MKKETKNIINSHQPEFGYELLSAIPYAKWLSENNQLDGTISGIDTKSLYYFSKNHKEEKKHHGRGWQNMEDLTKAKIPNTMIHTPMFDFSKFSAPDYKSQFANDEYKYDKPICVIANRYNREWGKEPVNFFDEVTLDKMFDTLKKKFQIIYIATDLPKKYQDNEPSLLLKDRDVCAKHKEVIIFQDIVEESWNTTILKVFANTEYFITMNGGYSILASYFGGKNIIFTKWCREVADLGVKSFWRWYPKFSGQSVRVARSEKDLLNKIDWFYIKEIPTMNVLIRTSQRENYFKFCIESVYRQSYPNVNIIVGCDDKASYPYTYDEKAIFVPLQRQQRKDWSHFPYNLYFNEMMKHCQDGFVCVLDDDDKFESDTAIEEIMNEEGDLKLWRVQFPAGRVIPNNENFGQYPVCKDISGIGFAISTDKIKDWTDKKGGDYRLITELYKENETVWIDKVLTGLQHCAGNGKRNDINGNYQDMKVIVKYTADRYKKCKFNKGSKEELDFATAKALQSKNVVKILKSSETMIEVEAIQPNVWGNGKIHQKGERFEISFAKAVRYEKQGSVIILGEKKKDSVDDYLLRQMKEEKAKFKTKEEKVEVETKEFTTEEKGDQAEAKHDFPEPKFVKMVEEDCECAGEECPCQEPTNEENAVVEEEFSVEYMKARLEEKGIKTRAKKYESIKKVYDEYFIK